LLERGYALVRTGDGRLLRSTQGVRAGADIQLELQDGKIDAVVERVHAQQ
jgi:exodeoxyribonuclease VII large subunit